MCKGCPGPEKLREQKASRPEVSSGFTPLPERERRRATTPFDELTRDCVDARYAIFFEPAIDFVDCTILAPTGEEVPLPDREEQLYRYLQRLSSSPDELMPTVLKHAEISSVKWKNFQDNYLPKEGRSKPPKKKRSGRRKSKKPSESEAKVHVLDELAKKLLGKKPIVALKRQVLPLPGNKEKLGEYIARVAHYYGAASAVCRRAGIETYIWRNNSSKYG